MKSSNYKFRTVEILKDNKWIESLFKDIKHNDVFRIFEQDGSVVKFGLDNNPTFIATSDAYSENGLYRVYTKRVSTSNGEVII